MRLLRFFGVLLTLFFQLRSEVRKVIIKLLVMIVLGVLEMVSVLSTIVYITVIQSLFFLRLRIVLKYLLIYHLPLFAWAIFIIFKIRLWPSLSEHVSHKICLIFIFYRIYLFWGGRFVKNLWNTFCFRAIASSFLW